MPKGVGECLYWPTDSLFDRLRRLPVERVARIRLRVGLRDTFARGELWRFELTPLVVRLRDPLFECGMKPLEHLLMLWRSCQVANFVRIRFEIVKFSRGHHRSTKEILRGRELAF